MSEDSEATRGRPMTAGDYVLIRKLGSGGFGVVYEARHKDTGLSYAVKRILLSDEDAERYRKEALYPARIASRSMHVLMVHSFFKDPKQGYFYLVTELIEHGDLRDFLERTTPPLPVEEALKLSLGIARGLVAIHDENIVHRDLKPRNILMDWKDGQWVPKITDFGLARSSMSVSLGEFASPGYAAPEQIDLLSEELPGAEADLFAFGMIVYELLTGVRASNADDLRSYGRWLQERRPPAAPSLVRPSLAKWPEIDAIVAALLEFDRTRRKSSAAEVVKALTFVLRAVERGESRPTETPGPAPAPPPGPPSSGESGAHPSPPVPPVDVKKPDPSPASPEVPTGRARWRGLGILALAFAATAAGLFLGSVFSYGIIPSEFWSWETFVLPGLFGFLLGFVTLGDWKRAVFVFAVSGPIYTKVAVTIVVRSTGPGGASELGLGSAYILAGASGAVLMTLAVALWRRQFFHPYALLRGLLAGALGGVSYLVLGHLGVLPWQILVGCALADYGIQRAPGAGQKWNLALKPVLVIAGVALFIGSASFGVIEWNERHPSPGTAKTNPKDDLAYRFVPAGKFQMGCSPDDNDCHSDESPAHDVEISKGFWIGQTEVPVGAWKKVVGNMPPAPSLQGVDLNAGWGELDLPVVNVTWDEARAYCAAVDGRLPTEAEWEYASRAGTAGARHGRLDDVAWYSGNTGKERIDRDVLWLQSGENSVEFARLLAANRNNMRAVAWAIHHEPQGVHILHENAWHLRDTLGNVWEWVEDDYAEESYSLVGTETVTDPLHRTGAPGARKVLRGGSWYTGPNEVRVSIRHALPPDSRSIDVGFRCVWNHTP